jgi:hypothetical protein
MGSCCCPSTSTAALWSSTGSAACCCTTSPSRAPWRLQSSARTAGSWRVPLGGCFRCSTASSRRGQGPPAVGAPAVRAVASEQGQDPAMRAGAPRFVAFLCARTSWACTLAPTPADARTGVGVCLRGRFGQVGDRACLLPVVRFGCPPAWPRAWRRWSCIAPTAPATTASPASIGAPTPSGSLSAPRTYQQGGRRQPALRARPDRSRGCAILDSILSGSKWLGPAPRCKGLPPRRDSGFLRLLVKDASNHAGVMDSPC